MIRGEAGIGKSALLAAAKSRAGDRGFRILTTAGVQSEAHLPFAGLHQLLLPVLSEVDGLPAPQREAVFAAFGITDRAAPDLFLIALATLHLLGEAAIHTPVLLLIDDAQWLDPSTADVLAFVARRLESDPIILLAAVRDGFENVLIEGGLPELRLEGLDQASSAALLDARAPGLASSVRARLLREAAGNPLALIELPAALRSAGIAGEVRLPAWLPLTTRLERAFAARVSGLPEATRSLLLVAAVDEGGVLVEVMRAAALADGRSVALEAVAPAVSAGLVEVGQTNLRFCHPLMRSAIYQAASLSERQAAHAAMAAVLTGEPDRRAWHRAASIVGPDEEVASELEETAARARRRGGIVAAVAALARAAGLTGDPGRRGTRLLRAAELAFELGRLDVVARLLREAEPLALAPVDLARMAWIREMVDTGSPRDPARVRALVAMADRMSSDGASDYTCVPIPYPGRDRSVAELKATPDDPVLRTLTIEQVIDHLVRTIRALPEKPIIMGHSFGGLLTQLMLQRDLGVAAVAIDSVPPQGVLTLKWSFIRSLWPVVNPFISSSRPYYMPFKHFQYTFGNDLPLAEQRAAYDADMVPESRRLARGGLTRAARVDFKRRRAPLLMIAGEKDHIMPASLNRSNYRRYGKSPSVTDFKEFPGRAHYSIIGGPGWEEVADYALNWTIEVQTGRTVPNGHAAAARETAGMRKG